MYKVTVPTIVTNGHFNREKTLAEIKRSGAQRIALAINRELGYAFSSDGNLELLKELIQYYKDNGLEVMVWLGEAFGHDGGKPQPSGYTNISFIDKGSINAFCPLDENFAADFELWIKKVAVCGAEMIMLDDDFRLGYRGGLGCCCKLHMKELEKELEECIAAEELRQKLFDGGKNRYRDAWLRVQGDSMRNFAKKLRAALDEVNPKIRLGFCCAPGSWDTEGWNAIEMAKIMAGKNKPFLRTIGAPYWAVQWNGYTIGEIAEIERTQLNRCRESGIEVFTEGDTYPRPRHECPAAYLECFDAIMRADGGSDGILKYMLDYVSDADYETGYIDAMVRNNGLYKEIDRCFSDKICTGVRPYNATSIIKNAEYDITNENLIDELQDSLFYPSLKFAVKNSLPVTYEDGYVNILFGENARYITAEELKNGNIIDVTAAKILMQRGVDVGVEAITANKYSAQSEYFIDEGIYTRLQEGAFLQEIVRKSGTREITRYELCGEIYDGAFEYENSKGMRFLVYPFDAQQAKSAPGWFGSYAEKRQLQKSIEWLGKRPLDAYIQGNYPYLYIMIKKNRNGLGIGLWNLFDDKIENARIKISGRYENLKFINCAGQLEGDTVILDGTLYPYEFAGIELEKFD